MFRGVRLRAFMEMCILIPGSSSKPHRTWGTNDQVCLPFFTELYCCTYGWMRSRSFSSLLPNLFACSGHHLIFLHIQPYLGDNYINKDFVVNQGMIWLTCMILLIQNIVLFVCYSVLSAMYFLHCLSWPFLSSAQSALTDRTS